MGHPLRFDAVRRVLLVAVIVGAVSDSVSAQLSGRTIQAAADPAQVVIEREPLVLRSPETYRVSLHLKPLKSVELTARADGIVSSVLINSGEEARQQSEIMRLESRERQLEMERAKAAFQAAQVEQRAAEQGTDKEVADLRLQIAKADLDLAEYRLDQTILRAPFEGTLQTVHVVEGQFVRSGEPLATLVDTSQLTVQIPIERDSSKGGDSIQIRVEGKVAPATVRQVLPLTEPFEPLRELFQSIATGIAVVDNKAGDWLAGQTVYPELVPRAPVTEVPNRAISNMSAGGRRVQVMRDGFVRDVPIELLGAVGEERTIVTGPFGTRDELIVQTSQELADGTQVVARTDLIEQSDPAPSATNSSVRPRQFIPPVSR